MQTLYIEADEDHVKIRGRHPESGFSVKKTPPKAGSPTDVLQSKTNPARIDSPFRS